MRYNEVMKLAASVAGGVLVPLAALPWICGCDLVSGLSEFQVAGTGGGAASCEPGSIRDGCPGSVEWGLPIASHGNVYVTAVIGDDVGRIYLALAIYADVSVAGKVLSHVGGLDSAIVALEPDGSVVWLKGAVGAGDDHIADLALGPDGDLLATGTFVADVDVAGATMVDPEAGGTDSFLVKLAANNGALRWSVQYSGVGSQVATALAADLADHIYVVGSYQGEITFDDGGAAEVTAGDTNGFVDKRGADGQELWHLALGDDQNQSVRSVAMTSQGAPVVVGQLGGTMTFDPGTSITAEDDRDLFVSELRSDGNGAAWARCYPAPGGQTLYAVSLAADDGIVLAGLFDAELQLDRPLTTNQPVLFAAALASDGEPRWSIDFPGTVQPPVLQRMVAVDGDAQVFLTGTFQDDAFVGTTLSSVTTSDGTPTQDVFTASFDAEGAHRWTRTFGADQDDVAGAAAVDAQGQVLFVGGFRGVVDFDQAELFESEGGLNGYLLSAAP